MADAPLPSRIDRAELERIIQRAAELQTSEREIGDGLTQDEVLALGKEVGIPERYLRQALLEERTRVAAVMPAGAWERIAGPGGVVAQRVVPGDVDDVADQLSAYLERHELFCVQRRQPGRITWEPIGGIQAAIRRSTAALGSGKRPYMLGKAATVAATILALEPGYVHVFLHADVRRFRGEHVGGGAALVGAGAASAALLVTLGAFLPVALIPLPLGIGLGYAVLRRFPPRLERVQLGLERALDHLEHRPGGPRSLPDRSPGLLGIIADEVRRALNP